jgi:cytochrome P450
LSPEGPHELDVMAQITIDTYQEAEDALRRSDLRQALYDEGAVLMKKVLVNLHGDEHLARKRVVTKILRPAFFHFYEKSVFRPTLTQTLAPYVASGKMDLVEFGYRVMLNLTADFAGIDRPARSVAETDKMLTLLRTFGKAATLGQALGDRTAIRGEIQRGLDEFDAEFFSPSMRRRTELLSAHARGEIAEADLPRDMLLVMLQGNADLRESHDVLMKEMAFYLMAGAHTSIHSMTHAVHEFLQWVEAHPEDRGRADSDPFFLQRCVYESIRLHPSSPTACRRPTGSIELPGKGRLSESDEIVIDLHAANRDVSVFGADAAVYNPHRNVGRLTSLSGLSFGTGMHACIGRNLAAGTEPRPDTQPSEHHYGTIPLVLRALLDHDVRAAPGESARMDTATVRKTWVYYPVLLH